MDAYESYAEIRRKILEKKKSRGFSNWSRDTNAGGQWKLSGTVRGKLEVLKSKTRCHHCGQFGHWKSECPTKRNTKISADKEKSEAM